MVQQVSVTVGVAELVELLFVNEADGRVGEQWLWSGLDEAILELAVVVQVPVQAGDSGVG